ncbi:MAG TPA: TonB family protein [Candidatus Angelobacter sp.]|jgi:periplasmic protein TonB|nr:TonB family protein [Candidatus Angelobacter sp.]
MNESRPHEFGGEVQKPNTFGSEKVKRVEPMANQAILPPPPRQRILTEGPRLSGLPEMHRSMLGSLIRNLWELMFPEKLPPLRMTARPVQVREIWTHRNPRRAATGSLTVHLLGIAALVAISIISWRTPTAQVKKEDVTLIAPPLTDYQPVMKPAVAVKPLAGGGGGGEHAKVFESKGKLPKVAPEQFTPPTVEIKNQKPKLAVEATVVAPPKVKLPDNPNMPNLGNPMSARVSGPASNGPGSGGGIGSGKSNGIGSGTGPGHGPGEGGGFGGGIYSIGDIGVTPPVAKFTPEPDFSEEARKAKYQGTVTLSAIIGPDGKPHNLKVVRSLGMGLDQKALEKVRTWLFEPGKRNGQPVAVAMTLEVDFRLF